MVIRSSRAIVKSASGRRDFIPFTATVTEGGILKRLFPRFLTNDSPDSSLGAFLLRFSSPRPSSPRLLSPSPSRFSISSFLLAPFVARIQGYLIPRRCKQAGTSFFRKDTRRYRSESSGRRDRLITFRGDDPRRPRSSIIPPRGEQPISRDE